VLLANLTKMSTLIVHHQWEDEMVLERTGRHPTYAQAKKMKSLILHTLGCLRGQALLLLNHMCHQWISCVSGTATVTMYHLLLTAGNGWVGEMG